MGASEPTAGEKDQALMDVARRNHAVNDKPASDADGHAYATRLRHGRSCRRSAM
jgi:hypothetical protein